MSGMMFADVDRDVGCCSCLGFLRKAGREMDSFTGDREYLIDGSLDCPNGYRSNDGGTMKRSSSFPAKNRAICREIPVKETNHLTRGEDSDGNKMVNEYVRVSSIGRGSYGKVVLYRSNNDGMQYAIKAFYKSRLSKVRVTSSETAMTDVRREVSIMKLLGHPNLINLVEVIDDPESDRFYMVLEYVEGKWICDASGACGGIGESLGRRYLRDIIAGLMYLHAHDDNDELWRSPGTPVFTAPECCLGLPYNGKLADAWAVGITLYCMILGYCPFIGDNLQDTYEKIVNTPLYIPEELDPELKDLLWGLLCKDPMQRLTLHSAAEHPWVVRECGPIPRASCRCKNNSIPKDNSSDAKTDVDYA